MVRALVTGTKTQTRSALRDQNPIDLGASMYGAHLSRRPVFDKVANAVIGHRMATVLCPYGIPGDRLWVREAFVQGWPHGNDGCPQQFDADGNELPKTTWYRATKPDLEWCTDGENLERTPWRPSIHMPRSLSRILLEVTDVRVERLQDISEADALAEGIEYLPRMEGFGLPDGSHFHCTDPRISYWSLWDAINGQGSVERNPLVWVVSCRRIDAVADQACPTSVSES